MSKEYPCIYYDNEKCTKYSGDGAISFCVLGPCSDETPSNADRIRQMSDEELADELLNCFAAFYIVEWSKEVLLEWLKEGLHKKL